MLQPPLQIRPYSITNTREARKLRNTLLGSLTPRHKPRPIPMSPSLRVSDAPTSVKLHGQKNSPLSGTSS